MLRIVIELDGEKTDALGLKEKLAMDFEKYGDVRVTKIERVEPKQMKMEEQPHDTNENGGTTR